jgi:hypothetical protein
MVDRPNVVGDGDDGLPRFRESRHFRRSRAWRTEGEENLQQVPPGRRRGWLL